MEAKKTTCNNVESLTEELSDEMLADCVGGTGFVNKQGKPVGAPAAVDKLCEIEPAGITYDPTGSDRASRWPY